jgi:L-ascorbate metabolism protein UlaG (beta-lactamase superfamily)
MDIIWSGHSCFTLRGKGTTLVLDPCPAPLGCVSRWGKPHAVLMSHYHPGHSAHEDIPQSAMRVQEPGEYEIGGAFITGIGSFHDSEEGETRGRNTIYVIEMEGLILCHVGDLGHPPAVQSIKEIGAIDILFVPVGDVSTLSVTEARNLVRSLQPRYVLPMHYKTGTARPELEPVETFLTAMGVTEPDTRAKLVVTATSLPLNTQVVVLTCDGKAG